VRKDPTQDPVTIKEVSRDPGLPWRPPRGLRGPYDQEATPFVLAGASRYEPQDAVAQAVAQVQQLAEAHTQAQQEADALAEAYEQALAALQAMQQGGGA
jgi:hypothetical protein